MPPTLRTTLASSLLLLALTACHRTPQLSPTQTLDAQARTYVRLAVALGERDKESLDYYYGPEALVADIHAHPPTYPDIRRNTLALIAQLQAESFPEPIQRQRVAFLLRQLHAIDVRIGMLTIGQQQAELPFDRESQGLLGITAPADYDHAHVEEIKARIAQLLPGKGSLADRYDAFDRQFVIPPARIPAVMTSALEGCRQQTAAHIPLPAGESVSLEYTSNEPWSAFSRYHGNLHSTIQVNTDFVLTVDRALQLACHEGYPGHHTFNALRDATLVRTTHWPELTVQTTFSPQSLLSESAATYATQMAFTDQGRLAFEETQLFPQATIDPTQAAKYLQVQRLVDQLHVAEPSIARGFLDGNLEYVHASEALQDQVLMAHTKASLLYFNEYRSYILTYTYGVDLLSRYIDGPPPETVPTPERWHRYQGLMTNPDIQLSNK